MSKRVKSITSSAALVFFAMNLYLPVVTGAGLLPFPTENFPSGDRQFVMVTPLSDDVVEDVDRVLNFSELTIEGKTAFRRGLEMDTVDYDSFEDPPPDFSYSDETRRYLVRYEGHIYGVRSWSVGFTLPELLMMATLFAVFLASLVIGVLSAIMGWFRLPIASLASVLGFYLSFVLDLYGYASNVTHVVGIAILLLLVPGVAAWMAIDRFDSPI